MESKLSHKDANRLDLVYVQIYLIPNDQKL